MLSSPQVEEVKLAYQMLDVPYSASAEDIKKAYRRITKRWHPDRYRSGTPAHAEATQMMKQINEAYTQIVDAPLQKAQDQQRRREPTHPPKRKPASAARQQPVTENYEHPPYKAHYYEPPQVEFEGRGRFHFWICFGLGCAYGGMAALFCMSLFPVHPVIAIVRSIALVLGSGYIYALWKG